ncbi:MAG: hypothetical protein Q9172_001523 [Xanthocarpia lactea]
MQLHIQICLILLYAVTICITTAVPSVAPAAQGLEVSALPDLPDQDFRYATLYRGPSFSDTTAVMAAVAAMHELASLNFNSSIRTPSTWTHPDYPGVNVTLHGDGRERPTVRFAMWIIHAGIKDMMVRDRYATAVFMGFYREVEIGRVWFLATPPAGAEKPQISAAAGAGNDRNGSSSDVEIASAQKTVASNDNLHADTVYLAKAMDKRDSFFTCIWLLMALGAHDNDPLGLVQFVFQAITVEVRSIWNTIKRPSSHPDVLRTGDMVNMIAHLPIIMMHDDMFREMNVIVSDEGVVIARGAIRTSPKPRKLALPSTPDVNDAVNSGRDLKTQ